MTDGQHLGRSAAPGRIALIAALAIAAVVLACQSPSSSPTSSPAQSPGPSGASPAATEAARAELVIGCISIQAAECRFVAERILASLPSGRGDPFAVEIQTYPCENVAAPCPQSLAVRTGKAVVEFLDQGEPIELTLKGPPDRPSITKQDAFYLGLSHASSPRVNGLGPFEYEMGHCGVLHVIDFDGSYWLPIGQVDGDSPTIINAERGTMRLLGASLAEFRGESGFVVQLARFPGPKHFWGCD
jgi:hypothetical protein